MTNMVRRLLRHRFYALWGQAKFWCAVSHKDARHDKHFTAVNGLFGGSLDS